MKTRTSIGLWFAAALIAASAFADAPKTTDSPKVAVKPVAATVKKFENLPKTVSEDSVKAHVIAPSNVQNVQVEEVDESKEVRFSVPLKKIAVKKEGTAKLNLPVFGAALHAILKDNVVGYILQVRQDNKPVLKVTSNWAQTPSDGKKGWDENTRMHVAGVSKYLTAVGMANALDLRNISYDAKIAPYLPSYWSQGQNINKITFRQLLTHKSGFSTGSSSSDYLFMKQRVAAGVSGVGGYHYENMNFGLMRILIPIVYGDVEKSAKFIDDAALNDQAWDAVTLQQYKRFMQNHLFTSSALGTVDFAPQAPNALAYVFPNAGAKGWDSGVLSSVAGGAGWRLSINELLTVMGQVRRAGNIMGPEKAQYMLDNGFGIDQIIDTPAGKIYNKNGAWGTGDKKTEQCVAYFMPDNIEVAVFVNSKIGTQDFSLRNLVKDVYLSSLTY